jgi:hypothetical protein
MSDDRPSLLTRLWRASLLVLGSAICIWLAIQLLSQIWIIVLIILGLAALVAGLIWWLRIRGTRW